MKHKIHCTLLGWAIQSWDHDTHISTAYAGEPLGMDMGGTYYYYETMWVTANDTYIVRYRHWWQALWGHIRHVRAWSNP